jgi:hypothetical protein
LQPKADVLAEAEAAAEALTPLCNLTQPLKEEAIRLASFFNSDKW